jgi:7-keto-8-aminopelargonate synthetase-like enzyme
LSKAARFVYPHGDCGALEELLKKSAGYRRRLIVTDSIFSMDGDFAPLVQLADLAERYDAMLMVDEAHATGVFGERGRGLVEEMDVGCSMIDLGCNKLNPTSNIQHPTSTNATQKGGQSHFAPRTSQNRDSPLHNRVHVRIGTLSKAVGASGGFVCGRRSLVEWLANRARSYVFSTAQPGAVHAAAMAGLEIVRGEPWRRVELLERAAGFRRRLREQGWDVGRSASQIVPIVVGDAGRTMELAGRLREAGFFVPGIRPPSVPEGESLLRVSLCWHHGEEVLEGLVKALGALRGAGTGR